MTVKRAKTELIIEYIRSHPEEGKKYKNNLIEDHLPFIVHTITQVTGRYVEVENSEELSIGLMAFDEAISKYQDDRGAAFLSFARLVITSRIKDWMSKEQRNKNLISLEHVADIHGDKFGMNDSNIESDMVFEVETWESYIKKFGFDLEQLVNDGPKHVDTRNNAIDLSEKISDDEEIVDHMYEKYKLPVTKVVLRFQTTKKIINRSKKFIIATVVILTKNLVLLKEWIYADRKRCS